MGRNDVVPSGTTDFPFGSITISANVAVIFRKKELHDNNTLLIALLFEHHIQIRFHMCPRSMKNVRVFVHDIVRFRSELCHDDKSFAEITVSFLVARLYGVYIISVLRAISHQCFINIDNFIPIFNSGCFIEYQLNESALFDQKAF